MLIDTHPHGRELIPVAPDTRRYGRPGVRFGSLGFLGMAGAVATVVGASLTWISIGGRPARGGFDVPFTFLWKGFNAPNSALSLGLIVAVLGGIGLIAGTQPWSNVLRPVGGVSGGVILGIVLATYFRLDVAGAAAVGKSVAEAFGIGPWIAGSGGMAMVVAAILTPDG